MHWLTVEPADLAAPTVAEINAGTDITGEVDSVNNFETVTAAIPIAGHSTPFVGSVRGRSSTTGDPVLVFFDRPDILVERGLLSAGSPGWIVLLPDGGPVSGARCEVWPVVAHGAANNWGNIQAGTLWQCRFSVVPDVTPETEGTVTP